MAGPIHEGTTEVNMKLEIRWKGTPRSEAIAEHVRHRLSFALGRFAGRVRRVVVRLELPGMSREDLDLQVTPELLTVRGLKRFERESTEGRWRVMQCAYGQFERQVALPVAVKTDEVRAVYKDGVLKVECPKAEVAPPRAVTVAVH